jgi:hypothetical protein
MTDNDEPTGADEPTRISRPTSSGEPHRVARSRDPGVPGRAASTTPGRRVDGSIDPPDRPVWARKPVIIGAVAAVVIVALLAFFLLKDDGDDEEAEAKGSTSQSSTTLDPLDQTTETTAPPASETTATTPPETDPEGTVNQTPTTALGAEICQAFNRLEEGVELVFNAGEVSDAEMLSRSDQLGDNIDTSVGLFESLADRPYGTDATTYAVFLEPLADEFREATTRDQVDALGDELLEPSIDVAEAASRLQDEWDAECG